MRYFIDTEFHEYHKQQKCLGIKIGKPTPTIDLVSIGIVDDEAKYIGGIDPINADLTPTIYRYKKVRSYYAISKDFNIKDAWNSYQLQEPTPYEKYNGFPTKKEYWLRENVLKPIFIELALKYYKELPYTDYRVINAIFSGAGMTKFEIIEKYLYKFNLKNFTKLINKYGKTNKQIAEEIHGFIYEYYLKGTGLLYPEAFDYSNPEYDPKFYAYYADYDWVVFAQLFGKMIDLPKGFPMYCRDLKQMLDEKLEKMTLPARGYIPNPNLNLETKLKEIKSYKNYPKQDNEHNALDDARWNKDLYKFIKQLK